jgi:hypothetical protein
MHFEPFLTMHLNSAEFKKYSAEFKFCRIKKIFCRI